MSLLAIEGVGKEYAVSGKRVVALESIDLNVAEGEFVTIVGPSGCGKSTLLNLIVGLLRSSSGRIAFRGGPSTASAQRSATSRKRTICCPGAR
jgi:NitT/TauT family transport system ATP-binding protein